MTLAGFINNLIGIVNSLLPILGGLAVVFFFWGLIRYIYNSGDAGGRSEGRDAIIWGLVGLFIIFTLWGILTFLQETFFYPTGSYYSTPGPNNINPNNGNTIGPS